MKHNLAGDAKEIRKREKTRNNWNVLREDNMDHPVYTKYFLSGRVSASKFIVDGADAVGSLVMRTREKNTNSLEHSRATDNTTLAYISTCGTGKSTICSRISQESTPEKHFGYLDTLVWQPLENLSWSQRR